MSEKPMMECGHAANATNSKGEPSCVICIGIHPGAEKVVKKGPNLTGRIAKCAYGCGSEKPSSTSLPFFEYCGAESREAQETCKHCGYSIVAHPGGRNHKPQFKCKGFEPRGDRGYDRYYCGCRGWD